MSGRRIAPRAGFPGGTPLVPIEFIGTAGSGNRRVELWLVEHAFIERNDPSPHWAHVLDAAMVGAFSRGRDLFVGSLDIRLTSIGMPCARDLPAIGARTTHVYQVAGSALLPDYKNRGIGVALYVAGAAYAARRGYAIAADACFDSNTSDEARRVWASRAFRERVVVGPSGLTAMYRG